MKTFSREEPRRKAVIVAGDMVTPYGQGIETCWNGLLAGQSMIRPISHFPAKTFPQSEAGLVEGLDSAEGSRVMAMLRPLLINSHSNIPPDAVCLLATTIGEIEYLEKKVLSDTGCAEESCPAKLLSKVEALAGITKPGAVISSACSSAGVAVAEAVIRITEGDEDAVLVVACDSVSEFLYAGFASLLALDSQKARPFDRNREGLNVGEAAGYILLMSTERATCEKREILGEVAAWGLSNDANHMTGPSRDGLGLAQAIRLALKRSGIGEGAIASISAHGTGTLYNDAMEMKAFKAVFKHALPTYSIKGAIGHTMAAAGLVEVLIALKSLQEQKIPATVGVEQVDAEAEGWVSNQVQSARGEYALSTNSGFGGVNAALLLHRRNAV